MRNRVVANLHGYDMKYYRAGAAGKEACACFGILQSHVINVRVLVWDVQGTISEANREERSESKANHAPALSRSRVRVEVGSCSRRDQNAETLISIVLSSLYCCFIHPVGVPNNE